MKKIFYIEDSIFLIKLIEGILEPEGYEVRYAQEAEEAFKILEGYTPDLILLDMMLPGMSGTEICRKLKENPKTKSIRVILITGLSREETMEPVTVPNVVGLIGKPFDNAEILDDIKKALGD